MTFTDMKCRGNHGGTLFAVVCWASSLRFEAQGLGETHISKKHKFPIRKLAKPILCEDSLLLIFLKLALRPLGRLWEPQGGLARLHRRLLAEPQASNVAGAWARA